MSTGDTTGVEALLAEADRWVGARGVNSAATPIVFDLDEYTNLPAQTAVYRAALALLTGDIAGTIAQAERALELTAPDDHLRRGAASALTGLANWADGDLDRARDGYVAASEHFRDIGFVSDLLGCSLALADIQLAQGRPREAQRTYESALKHASEHNVLRGTADMHVGLSELLTERNELDESERHLQITAELGDHAGLPQNAYRRRVAAALLAFARGNSAAAIDLLDDALPLVDTDFSPAARPVAAIKARVQLASGDIAGAERWARSVGPGIEAEPTYVREYEHITLARTMLARRSSEHSSLDATIVLLRRLLAAAEAGSRGGAVIEVLVLLAAAHQAAGERSQATAALERALTFAAPEGYVRIFLDVTPSLAPLIDSVTLQGVAGEHLVHIRGSVSDTHSESNAGLAAALSARELEVVRLLRSDLSGPDLARELHVSLNTLRTHTKNIFTKLGVTNRREAVRRAAELGL
jgi:LuxR family maltose regulon positive regulatory protein